MKPRTIDALLQGHSKPPVWLGAVDGATSRLTLVVEAPARKASRQCGEGAVSSCLITTPKCMSVGVDAFHGRMWLNDNTDMKSRE